jgi:hypothetical protein
MLSLIATPVFSQFPDEAAEQGRYVGPVKADIELLAVRETSPFGSRRPLVAEIKNNSEYYLDRLAIQCTITDDRGFRLFRDLVFKSSPSFSVHIEFPPIKTPEMGVPPGAATEVGLYTTDNRWTRGHGAYVYDCDVYGVAGRK